MQLAHKTPQSGSFGRMAGVMALGFVAGLAANGARKAVMQAPSLAAGDWFDALKAEHRMVETMFKAILQTTSDDPLKRHTLLAKIAYALNKHAIEEENVVYPALRHELQPENARRLGEEHAEIKSFLYDLRTIPADDPRWLIRANEFEMHVARHIREEEDEIFPSLKEALSPEDDARLTKMLNWEGFKVA